MAQRALISRRNLTWTGTDHGSGRPNALPCAERPLADWDQRHRQNRAATTPSSLLVEFRHLLPPSGLALDIACGGGRNAVYLARRGLRVVGLDQSWEALRQGRKQAAQAGVQVDWVRADLEEFHLPYGAFDLVVCFYYRDPSLYPAMRVLLRPGGWLIYQTFTIDQLHFSEGPRNPAHLLRPGELLGAFADWRVVYYRESRVGRGEAALVTRKPGQ